MPLISITFSMKLISVGLQLFSGSLHPSITCARVVSSLHFTGMWISACKLHIVGETCRCDHSSHFCKPAHAEEGKLIRHALRGCTNEQERACPLWQAVAHRRRLRRWRFSSQWRMGLTLWAV